jgi:hypothetical protein
MSREAPSVAWPFADEDFDRLLPTPWREKAGVHFTPVDVARRATEMLVVRPGMRVLDVGAAVGKFCLVGARTMPDALFVGIERRHHLVRVAEDLARQLEVPNVVFAYGDATEIDWSGFDAFYFFNPFAEHLIEGVHILDDALQLHPDSYLYYVRFARAQLAEARIGTRVVAYSGFGGTLPPGYSLIADEPSGADRLELWVKTRPSGREAGLAS